MNFQKRMLPKLCLAFSWQYTRVPVDYNFSNIKHEILDELCILPEFELLEEGDDEEEEEDCVVEYALRSGEDKSFGKKLQLATLDRAGYILENRDSSTLRSWLSNTLKKLDPTWTPKANIKAWDDFAI